MRANAKDQDDGLQLGLRTLFDELRMGASMSAAAIGSVIARMAQPGSVVPVYGAGLAAVRGFVLPELLVVLLLLGLLGALALPNLERLQGAVTARTERDYILDQIAGLGRQAMLQERAYVVLGTRREGDAEGSDAARMTPDAAREQPRAAFGHSRRPASHPDHEHYVIDLPEGWEIRLDEPLVVYANGVCLGAGLTLYVRGAEDFRTELDPPYCRVDPDG